ncbi:MULTISPECIES: ABC transporter ATP-binding protein [unclassified Oceanispirochaeta]|uniref:ABC transporter ATP-binding protein n=1 Tax=unclassified Oceanispirochaeta TaxID=2635722 RepID=UPI000E090760|nr:MULTISPECIES: ABC transporter ATP-binding protein [unclassified Oceanispirochaeta]MBF9017623.1 ABC transporter ATP-binding protein [Oceanispirochaeta sp. M2]NPD74195.1 ABC transporter ATP-binding protein [Oceanispirochaeta sp. M1]RDG30007.1 ABC transporter ATP-binding protein [Oceanispirochaeta sp. M1]
MVGKSTVIETKNLCKSYYASQAGVHVLTNLNIEIYKGDFTMIMGASGSGKTTLLYGLSALDKITSGEVFYSGTNVHKMTEKSLIDFRRKTIGYIFQGINLIPYLSLLENVSVIGKLVSKNGKDVISRSKEMLCKFGLENEMYRIPAEVSGGQQQRAAVARALINNCEVLFADEPTGALNTSQGDNLLDTLTTINNNDKSIVMVTHDLRAACRGNRIIYLKDGKVHGELSLPPFNNDNLEEREHTVYNFLRKRGW